jgi:branched-chain amino acid transport system permease protein
MSELMDQAAQEQRPQSIDHRTKGVLQSLRQLSGKAWVVRLALLLAVVLVVALPAVVGRFWTRVLVQAGIWLMMALGLNVQFGYAGLSNLGYAAYFAIGAYTYAILASPHFDIHLPFLLLFPLAGALSALAGGLLSVPALSLRGSYLALVTLGFGEVIRLLIRNLSALTGGPQGIILIDHPSIASFEIVSPRDYYYLVLCLCVAQVFLTRRLEASRIGRAWKAIREDQDAAGAMGIDTRRLKVLACAIGTLPAGLAGVLFASIQTFVNPESFTQAESVAILSQVVIGGAGSIPGVILGALLLNVAPEPLRRYTEAYRMFIYGILLILFIRFRPQGLWPASGRLPWREAEPPKLGVAQQRTES